MEEQDNNSNKEALDSELESKITVRSRSVDRAHSTESGDEEPITDINVTPLVDVALVLVIIFMAVSPFMLQAGILVSESKAGAATGKASLAENVQVRITDENKIMINDEEIDFADLGNKLKERIPKSKDQLVTVQAGEAIPVGRVVEVLDVAKQSGAKKIAILNQTNEPAKTAEVKPAAAK